MTEFSRLLGFDFGLKRIGVAYGQTVTKSAKALCNLAAKKGEPDWEDIRKLIGEWRPEALIVGLPLNMDGSEQNITQKAKAFASNLENYFKLPVFTMDERLTTIEARAHTFESGGYKALQTEALDAVAAKFILESWMNQHA